MSYTYEEYIKYKIEREIEHLAWLKKNIPNSERLIARSKEKIADYEDEIAQNKANSSPMV